MDAISLNVTLLSSGSIDATLSGHFNRNFTEWIIYEFWGLWPVYSFKDGPGKEVVVKR